MLPKLTFTKNDSDHKNKDFAELNFGYTPMIAAMTVLSEMQTVVAKAETTVLNKLATYVGAKEIPFDKIEARVSPESRVVAAGTPYKAKLFIAASSSAADPVMESSAGQVTVDQSGMGGIGIHSAGR